MKRVSLFLGLLIAAAAASAQQKIPLRFSTAAPPPDFLSRSMQQFKAELEKAAPEFDVQLHYASSLFRQGTEVPAMQRGNLEMSTMTTFEVAQQVAELGFFNRAYLFRDYEHAYKTLTGGVGKRYADLVAQKMGIVVLAPTYLGTRQVALRNRPRGEGSGRSRGRQAPHAWRPRLAAPRAVDRRDADADGNARGVPRAADRRHRRPGKPAHHLQRREVPRGVQADGAHLAPGAAGVLCHRQALFDKLSPDQQQEARRGRDARGALERRASA